MDSKDHIASAQNALKLVCDIDDSKKEDGLDLLKGILDQNYGQLVDLGYDLVIFKELIKIVQFDSGVLIEKALDLLQAHYYIARHLDELAEVFIYRFARSTDKEVCRLCLMKISTLLESFDESVAKHSKQLLKLADLNEITDLNPVISDILEKLKTKLPVRKDFV